ncbi:cAMP-regulated phosphoprotein 19-like [Watersipora subatra]|uniref:cAMP-regulated phosphoprotein 19-like n=1 Tax=Watersipora subatra TaxID=2589382 RepID=UPI00355C2BA9
MSDENVNMEVEQELTEQSDAKEMEKQQEAILKSKYPQINRAPGGGSALLHKRLHKQKFFDSGDYNVTKSKIGHKPTLTPTEKTLLTESTGNAIPTAEEVHKRVTHRTSSLASDEPISPNRVD